MRSGFIPGFRVLGFGFRVLGLDHTQCPATVFLNNAEYGSCPACCSMFCLGKPIDTQNAHDLTCRVHGLGFILNTLISGTCNLWHKFEDSVDRSAIVLIRSKWVYWITEIKSRHSYGRLSLCIPPNHVPKESLI